MEKIRCNNCKFKHDIGNTDTSGKAICEFPRSFQLIDRKKKRSNSSKAKAKSDHKHTNKACLLICNTSNVYYANYCIICGKIINWEIPMEKESGYYRELSKEEIFERYNGLEHKEITDIFDKYIPI